MAVEGEVDVDDGEMVVSDVDPRAKVVDDPVVEDPPASDVVGVNTLVVVVRTVVLVGAGFGSGRAVVAGGDVDTVPYWGTGAGRTRM
jgi:hypothetical protein